MRGDRVAAGARRVCGQPKWGGAGAGRANSRPAISGYRDQSAAGETKSVATSAAAATEAN